MGQVIGFDGDHYRVHYPEDGDEEELSEWEFEDLEIKRLPASPDPSEIKEQEVAGKSSSIAKKRTNDDSQVQTSNCRNKKQKVDRKRAPASARETLEQKNTFGNEDSETHVMDTDINARNSSVKGGDGISTVPGTPTHAHFPVGTCFVKVRKRQWFLSDSAGYIVRAAS